MISMNGNGRPKPIIEIPPKGSLDRLLYDMDGLFGLVVEYKGKREGRSFSDEGIEGVIDGFQSYVYAQIARRWNDTGKPPKQMLIKLNIDWDIDDENLESVGQVFLGDDDE